jgi:DNA-binding transcriptional MerR regulator
MSNLQAIVIKNTDDWMTRSKVAIALKCSVTKVRAYEARDKLHPVSDAGGVWKFDPAEVEKLQDELGIEGANTETDRAVAYARVDLGNSIKLVKLLTDPREKLDIQLFATIDRQAKRIEDLEARLIVAYEKQQAAEDRTGERELATKIALEKEERWTQLFARLMSHGEKLLGGTGTPFLHSLTAAQMGLLQSIKEEFTPEQRAAIDAAANKLGLKVEDDDQAEHTSA